MSARPKVPRLRQVAPERCKICYLTYMDKVISARIDEEVAALLDSMTKRYHRTKKEFLESAIRREAEAQESVVERRLRIIRETAGAWDREEPPEETIRRAREESERTLRRYEHLGREAESE